MSANEYFNVYLLRIDIHKMLVRVVLTLNSFPELRFFLTLQSIQVLCIVECFAFPKRNKSVLKIIGFSVAGF
jgi:hypothetical protein